MRAILLLFARQAELRGLAGFASPPCLPTNNGSRSRTLILASTVALLFALPGCDYIKKQITHVRIKVLGITVCEPDRETAEWVLMQVLEAMNEKDTEAGWENFQRMLHTNERSPNALRGWHQMGWRRMRRQKDHYLDGDGCYKIVKLREMESTGKNPVLQGLDFYLESKLKEMGTPCSVYKDKKNGNKWRIKRCSL